MPLVAPLLRLVMVLLNVYETFKVLKMPQPSTRHGGKPSVRAISQRKRDMKGCLTVWIVWCCLTLYERVIEGIVSLFIPFYDELKSLILVFLILTRARSAEPIFLHLIRPVLKPYTPTLDMILDLSCMFGDIAYLVVTTPIRHAQAWWYQKPLDSETEPDVQEPQTKFSSASNPPSTADPHITIKKAASSTVRINYTSFAMQF
ncbi:hypothetical protein BDN72DRAFT_772325 [Pluteus cervinus]|uniref:Uncharacterized protein n=1 Tax=Pluteus cervinus TaxID=181527 RepID=A0ACD3AL03_9AGAR|nr:hypothetical protein BDN72DRAFT_772325 [Pluteus cervinus]